MSEDILAWLILYINCVNNYSQTDMGIIIIIIIIIIMDHRQRLAIIEKLTNKYFRKLASQDANEEREEIKSMCLDLFNIMARSKPSPFCMPDESTKEMLFKVIKKSENWLATNKPNIDVDEIKSFVDYLNVPKAKLTIEHYLRDAISSGPMAKTLQNLYCAKQIIDENLTEKLMSR